MRSTSPSTALSSSWATGEFAAASSRASRPSALPEAYCSQQPRLPHSQRWPPGMMIWWPNSPATPKRPRSSRPSITMAPPIPVPRVMQTSRSLSLPGAEAPFRPGGGVGVVGQQDGAAQQPLQVVPQRFVAPGQVRAEEDGAAVEVHPAGGADPHRPDPVAGAQFLDEFDDDLFHGARVVAGRGAFRLAEDPALGVDDAGSDLGAPDVDADGQARAAQPQVLNGGRARPWRPRLRPGSCCARRRSGRRRPGCRPGVGVARCPILFAGAATAAKARPTVTRQQSAAHVPAASPTGGTAGLTVKLLASRCRRTHLRGAAY